MNGSLFFTTTIHSHPYLLLMLKYLTIFVGVLLGSGCFSQTTDPNLFYKEQVRINQDGMKVLGGWAAANMIASGIATGQASCSSSEMLKGYGQSLILQGGFLFLFDGAMYLLHHKHGVKHSKLLNQIAFDGQRISIKWVF